MVVDCEKSRWLEKGITSSDAEVSEHLKRRDEHAFLQLYDRHHRTVYRFLVHMTGSITSLKSLPRRFSLLFSMRCAQGRADSSIPKEGHGKAICSGLPET